MSIRLRRSRVESPASTNLPALTPPARVDTLSDLARGEVARIVEVRDEDDPEGARRMVDLGFEPGVEVRMVRRAPLADPVVFQVGGHEVALRRAQARCIRVSATR